MPRKTSARRSSARTSSPRTSVKKTMETQIRHVVAGDDDLSRARARRAPPAAASKHADHERIERERQEYERRATSDAQKRLDQIQRAPLADRKEAQSNFLAAMRKNPGHVAETVDWILAGHYGFGEMKLARDVLASPRMNRAAALTHLAAAFEWSCPSDLARAAWHKLSQREQDALDDEVQRVIRQAEEAAAEG